MSRSKPAQSGVFKGIDCANGYGADFDWKQLIFNILGMVWEWRKHPLAMNFLPLVILLGFNVITGFLPEEAVLWIARIMFAGKFVVFAGAMFKIDSAIKAAIEDGELEEKVTVERTENNDGIYETTQEKISYGDHDKEAWYSFGQNQMIGTAISAVVHYWGAYTAPLVISSVMGIIALNNHAMFRVYIKGEEDEELKRPWKNQGGDMMEQWKKNMTEKTGASVPTTVVRPPAKPSKKREIAERKKQAALDKKKM